MQIHSSIHFCREKTEVTGQAKSVLDGNRKRKITSNLVQHVEKGLISDQRQLEYRRERSCRQEEMEVVDRSMCHQTRVLLTPNNGN